MRRRDGRSTGCSDMCLRLCGFVCLPVGLQGVGVSCSPLPASLFEHMSMDQALNPPTRKNHTLCSLCSCAPSQHGSHHLSLVVCCHRHTRLSPLARRGNWRWSFLRRHHNSARCCLQLKPFTPVSSLKKVASVQNLSQVSCERAFLYRCQSAKFLATFAEHCS